MTEQLNLYQKLAKARKGLEVIKKDKRGYGYNYVSEDVLWPKVTAYLDKYHLSLIPGIVPGTFNVQPYSYSKIKPDKTGKQMIEEKVNDVLVTCEMTWTWVNNDNPDDRLVIPWGMTGQQSDASQAFGSGLTYAERYFLLKYFNISTTDADPDNYRSRQKEAMDAENKAFVSEVITAIDTTVKDYLGQNPDKADSVKKFISKYAKNANYFSITEPAVATKLLEDFGAEFSSKG